MSRPFVAGRGGVSRLSLHHVAHARTRRGGVLAAWRSRASRAQRRTVEGGLRRALRRDDLWPRLASVDPPCVCFPCRSPHGDGRARLEVIFDKPRPLDDWTCQLIEAATQLSSMVLELERAIGRGKFGSSLNRSIDGAAPLIGASEAIRRVRERIERVAATDFTVLIEGGSGPQPHPIFIEVFRPAPFGGGYGGGGGSGAGWAGRDRMNGLGRRP